MNILILGLNYQPEPVGIGPYTSGTAEFLAASNHNVTVVCGKPYYPNWKVQDAFQKPGTLYSVEREVRVHRVPIYVPARPSGWRRLLHHASFAIRAFPVLLRASNISKPDVIICVAPSLISVITARTVARFTRSKVWVHVQDFEVDAAFVTGLLRDGGLIAKAARRFERWCLNGLAVSTISPQMCNKLNELGVRLERVYEFRNWANIDSIKPLTKPSIYRKKWGIVTSHVALYSGNLGNKQGIEIIPEIARILIDNRNLTFVVCGNGASRERLISASEGLPNIIFRDLQPPEMMSELLGLATVHLLPQLGGAADLVLPSKLANMLASGRPVLATAAAKTGLAYEVAGCGRISPPENGAAMAAALENLLADGEMRNRLGDAGRARAELHWRKDTILAQFEAALRGFCKAT